MTADEERNETAEMPLLSAHRNHDADSLLTPAGLLREARRQKGLADEPVPDICILDPDGDLLDHLREAERTRHQANWACYHTTLDTCVLDGVELGIIGRVVGAPFAVLVAEELFASGCRFLISISSAGQIAPLRDPPYMVLIERALRDEGTSYHYRPPSRFSHLGTDLREALTAGWDHTVVALHTGASWTTDAPFRETEEMISACRVQGILAVEMEAAALYALAEAKRYPIVCFAYVTNQMGRSGDNYEKGSARGAEAALAVVRAAAHAWRRSLTDAG